MFSVKKKIASTFNRMGILDSKFHSVNNGKKNYIRVVNYHETPECDSSSFVNQLVWFKDHFTPISQNDLYGFLDGQIEFDDKPGLLLTFDDGKANNYTTGKRFLEENGFWGLFFISSALIGHEGYMTWEQVVDLLGCGHGIGCHTATHHRMDASDSPDILEYEIMHSKKEIENHTGYAINSFCWCGGEEEHYTKKAGNMIKKAGYSYSFLTNSQVVLPDTNHYMIERTNIEADWSLSLVKFQLCGFMDNRFAGKRNRVESLLH